MLGFLRQLECVIRYLFLFLLKVKVLRFGLSCVACAWLRQRDHLGLDALVSIGFGLPRAGAWSRLAFVRVVIGLIERHIMTFLPFFFIYCAHALVSNLTGGIPLINRCRSH